MLIDSNIIILASKLQNAKLLSKLKEYEALIKVSVVSKIEVLGYHQLNQVQKKFLINFFNAIPSIFIDNEIVDLAIEIRQKRPVSLGDALIAATAINGNLELLTENVKDYKGITDLRVLTIEDFLLRSI
jgi:hypothetical protein